MSDQGTSEQPINGPKCIEIPRGWGRILENGSILYISPNNSRLRSLDHVIEYLKTEGTCKCGLECPFFIHKVFNFDARIPSKLIPVNSRTEPSQSGCKHCVIEYLDVVNNPQQPSDVAANQANDAKLPAFSTLAQKRGPGRPRNPLSKSRRVSVRKHDLDRSTSPLHNIPLPVPSSIANSPVQSVPTNIAVEQGPLPSFATIVSSSKLFNPGAGLGNTMLASSTVTSAVSSSPIAAVSVHSSKTATVASNVASRPGSNVAVSSPVFDTLVSMVPAVTEASQTTASVTSTVVVSHQRTTAVSASLPTRSQPENTLPKSTSSLVFGKTKTPVTTLAPSSKETNKLTIVSSSTTSVVSTSTTTISITKQDVKSVANSNKLPEVKVTSKVAAPRTSKSTKAYGPRKTVAATLKAAAAAKASTVPSEGTKAGISNPVQRTYQVATTATTSVPSSEEKMLGNSASKPQVLPTPSITTTVQAPALFHSVLKDAIIMEQGSVVSSTSPSTNATVQGIISTTHAATNHGSRGALPVSSASSRSKSAASKENTQVTTALIHGVQASHLPPSVSQHVPAHRPQPPVTGYSVASGGFCSPTPLATASQQQNVPATTMAQSAATQTSAPVSAYGQVQHTAGSSQIPSLQITASQAQGGVFFQGNGNQVFQMNVDSSQLKGAYQLHGTLYQGAAIPATFLAAANVNKAASSNPPAAIPHAMYPTNPYMLGIVMPAALTQSMPNQPGQTVPTTATSPSATAAAVAAAPVASYSYNNQNAAIAAAFESFVPIAPAASPRFSQTLAHLASAYTPFLPRGAVQGNTPVQFAAQRMVSMSTMHSQSGGNGQMGQTVLNLGDYAVKYPINTAKPGSYGTQASTVSSVGQANTHQQTAVVAAMPYVAFSQINHPRFPFSVNFAAPSVSTNPSVTSSSPSSPACSFVTSANTPHQYGSGSASNTDSHAGGAVLGYVAMPFSTNPGGTTHSLSAPPPHHGSAFSPPSSHSATSHSSQRMDVSGSAQHLPLWCGAKSLPGVTNQRRCSTPESTSSGSCSVANSSASFSVPSNRSSCMEVSTSSGTATSFSQSPRHPGVTSPLNSPLTMLPPNQGLSACRGSPKGDTPLPSGRSSVDSVPSRFQSLNANESRQTKTSSSEASCALKRTYNDSSEQAKKAKYDESAYYEANPLLGLKRSCEAIEAYCSPERDDDDDDEDNDIDDRSVTKNEEPSPVNHPSGEGNRNSKKCSNLNSRNENENGSKGITNSDGDPISDKRQSHSVYNGDVSPNQNQGPRVQMVTQDAYLPVKTNPLSSNTAGNQERLHEPPVPITRPQFEIGDIVWAQARGLPSWPGKVVDASEVGKGRPDDGKRWVMWFGDHTFSQVEVDRLKTLSDGLRTLDDKARKKKYKAKKARIGLEQAISEALEALDVRERLRDRQAARSKAKKKRLR